METISINEVEYSVEDLSNEVKEMINRVVELRGHQASAKRQIGEIEATINAYSDAIADAVEGSDDDE